MPLQLTVSLTEESNPANNSHNKYNLLCKRKRILIHIKNKIHASTKAWTLTVKQKEVVKLLLKQLHRRYIPTVIISATSLNYGDYISERIISISLVWHMALNIRYPLASAAIVM